MIVVCEQEATFPADASLAMYVGFASAVDLDEVARVFPYGKLLPIEVTTGGLTFGCGRVVTELGDEDDTGIVAVAAVSLGYHDPSDAALSPRTWDTRDGH